MIERDDLKAAVGAGLVTEAQAAALVALSDARRGARTGLAEGDEPFELFRGFNEVFVVLGLAILATGWQGLSAALAFGALGLQFDPWRTYAGLSALGAGIVWLLSEYFVRRRRMVAPAIVLAVFFGLATGGVAAPLIAEGALRASLAFDTAQLIGATGIVAGGLALHFWRFRVPITMAAIALALFAATLLAVAGAEGQVPELRDLFVLSASGPFALATLGLGLAVFAVAMAFDMSDPHRVTRRAANGFWLHLVAAPAIVNTVALSLLADPTGTRLTALAGVLVLLAAVAIVIDRRSFLVAGAGYTVILSGLVGDGTGAAAAILAVGAGLLLLGAFWERARARLLRVLGSGRLPSRLPPAHLGSGGPRP